ncbi:MAG TPA: hypothetical protein VML96_00190, partial [Egibacteraceae bacterium]|nr:hypothetical protein [Egibacteraceae bacterium]
MSQPRAPGPNADRAPTRLGGGPFGAVAPVMAAAAFIVAAAFAAAFTGALPGGRWAVVHLVTLGVASPLILAFSHQFAGSVTQGPADRSAMPLVAALYAGALMVIVGLPSGQRWVTAVGGTAASAAVLASYVRLRRMRRGGGRFAWLLRGYERAHGAFLHGALLGLLIGVGAFRGDWYGAARLAHLHAMVAGWVGVTILATVVFFAPAMLR